MKKRLLSILIPTYNRQNELLKNIALLSQYIRKLNCQEIVEIIISDNYSNDNTVPIIEKYIDKNKDINIRLYKQSRNNGLERNAIFVLSKSNAKYVMYLGDDDYPKQEYLEYVINEITHNNTITCIVPSIIGVKTDGTITGNRDVDKPTRRYKRGFNSVIALMDKGHQLSGVTFLREGTLKAYEVGGLPNIYPFMFFVGFNCIRGESLHLTKYPVNVTEGVKKDWGYKDDGLLGDIFNNTYMLFQNNLLLRSIEEFVILKKQTWRLMMYFKKGLNVGILTYFKIIKLKNLTIFAKFAFTILLAIRLFKKIFYKILLFPSKLKY